MKLDGMFGVVETIERPQTPYHDSDVCICKTLTEAKAYLKKSFKETLFDDIEDCGIENVEYAYEKDGDYAKIVVSERNNHFIREFYLCNMFYDPR